MNTESEGFHAAILLVTMAALGAIGLWISHTGGAMWRYPEAIRPVLTIMQFNPNADNVFRCWMPAPAGFDKYPANCGDGDTVVWGDSHAGRLHAGLIGDKVGEFVGDACPPVLGVGDPVCIARNAAIMRRLGELKPKRVVLFAFWSHYTVHGLNEATMAATLRELKQIGADVLVVGAAPEWQPDLPSQVYLFWRFFGTLPDRLPSQPHEVDDTLSRAASSSGVRFVSLFDALCNAEEGCLTHTPASQSDLLTWDYGHLTTPGARFLADILKIN